MRKAILFCGSLLITNLCMHSYEGKYVKENVKRLRNLLYKSYADNSSFHKDICMCSILYSDNDMLCACELLQNIDFFIEILEEHIIKLQKKIDNPTRFYTSCDFYKNSAILSIGVLLTALSYLFFTDPSWPKKEDYVERITDFRKALKFAQENPSYLGSNSFVRQCIKDSFDRDAEQFRQKSENMRKSFELRDQCFEYYKNNPWQLGQCFDRFPLDFGQKTQKSENYKSNFEKRFKYLDVYHISRHSSDRSDYLLRAIGLSFSACCCVITSLLWFKKFYTSTYRHKKYLKRDKELLAILKAEKYGHRV